MENNKEKVNSNAELILFTFQIIVLLVVICVSSLNLTFEWGNQNLWTAILIGSIGYIMPNPKLKTSNNFQQLDKKFLNTDQSL